MALSMPKKSELITKHAKKFAAKSGSATPVLEGIHYAADGSAVICDRHRLLRIKDAHNYAEPLTSHAKTGETIDGTYPPTEKIFPVNFTVDFVLLKNTKVNEIQRMVDRVKLAYDIAHQTDRDRHLAVITFAEDGAVTLSVTDSNEGVSFSAHIGTASGELPFKITLNSGYLLDAMNVFKDAGSAVVTVKFSGALNPIALSDEANGIDALITPFRAVN
jgi:DNA polymerase III sliding clamp (beta) subunit (PCNA family)